MSSFSGSGGGGAADGNTVGAAEAPVFAVSGYFGSNVTLSGTQSATQGSAANGEVVLVANNTNATQNGLYTVNTGGAWSRLSYYTAALVIRSQIRVISPPYGGKFAVFDYVGATDPVVFGSSSIPYAIRMNETNSTDFNIRGLVSAGPANLNFLTNGGSVGSVATAVINRWSGANGSWNFDQAGSGDINFYSPVSSAAFFFQNSPVIAAGGFGSSNTVITSGTASTLTTVTSTAIFNPAATIAAYTLTLPTSPRNGTRIKIAATNVSGGAVTTLTLTPGGTNTIDGAITTLAANAFAEYMFAGSIGASGKWVRIG